MRHSEQPPAFIYRHIVCLEETNLFSTVYFARHVAWQGACREMFLRAHAPGTLRQFSTGLRLVTVRLSCEYINEVYAFEEVELRMSLSDVIDNRILLRFDYRILRDGAWLQIAQGDQEIRSMIQIGETLAPCPIPSDLAAALNAYRVDSLTSPHLEGSNP